MDNKRSGSFPKDTVAFLKKLSKNNNRDWFSANRNIYDKDFLEPAIHFVVEMGEKLQKISLHIQAIPKIDKSIFRIHRDVRFSKDKEPYKTNMGLYFWEGPGKKWREVDFISTWNQNYLVSAVECICSQKNILKNSGTPFPIPPKEKNWI